MGSGLSLLSPLGFPVSFRPGFGVLPLSLEGGVGHQEAQVRTGFTHSLTHVGARPPGVPGLPVLKKVTFKWERQTPLK